MILKLGMQHRGPELYKICINGDPGLTLTYFTARSNLVACVFEMAKTVSKKLNGKNLQQESSGPRCCIPSFKIIGLPLLERKMLNCSKVFYKLTL